MSKDIYGNKGANLKLMQGLGLPVPKFFIINAGVDVTENELQNQLHFLAVDKVSVRSSPNYSLPGILDTTLNVDSRDYKLVHSIVKQIKKSVNSKKVAVYKDNEGINDEIKTAVIIQQMVDGYKGGTGVIFSSNPITGDLNPYGEYLIEQQGQALVNGEVTPLPISDLKIKNEDLYNELVAIAKQLENHFLAIQDIEFTFVGNKLYILQTRNAKIIKKANMNFYTRLLNEDKITTELWAEKTKVNDVSVQREYDMNNFELIAMGIGASSGLLCGKVTLCAEGLKAEGDKIYVANMTSTDDIEMISNVQGLLTVNGGKTSHAAIVSRSWGKVCVVGCSDIEIQNNQIKIGGNIVNEGEEILINGDNGEVYLKK